VEPLALPIRARFVPLPGHRTPRLTGVYRASRSAGSSPSCSPDGGLALCVPAAGAGCRIGPRHLIEAPTEGMTGCASPPPEWRPARRRCDRRGARIWTARRASASCNKGSRCPRQGLGPADPVMCLSWTGDGPVMYLPYTCAGDAPDHLSGSRTRPPVLTWTSMRLARTR
jgi:hypothetical protein